MPSAAFEGMLPTLLFRPTDASEMANRWFKSQVKGGTGKAEVAKLPDAGISLKQCPMERVETEAMHLNQPHR